MSQTGVQTFDRTVQQGNHWLNALAERMETDKQDAFHALRAVLAATRDNLDVHEAADLGAQLPLLVRGLYYEGFSPRKMPARDRDLAAFLDRVRAVLPPNATLDPERAARSVFAQVGESVTDGQAEQVKNMFCEEVQELWPGGFDRAMPGNRVDGA